MSAISESWELSRQRFVDTITGLSDEQYRWRLHDKALSIGEMAIHVAGVEFSFGCQLLDKALNEDEQRIRSAATDGVLNDLPFPFKPNEITGALVSESLARAKSLLNPLMSDPTEAVLGREVKSVIGPLITGQGALARLSFHPAYHLGQAYLIKSSPGFPK
jgi:hypothetical protein